MSEPNHSCEVAVIGAGPYGLSVAAHLKRAGIATAVFGDPMAFWRHNMPKGMMLRSPWGATDLSTPDGTLSLGAFTSAHGIAAEGLLPLEKFVDYGAWFQHQAVPGVDPRSVSRIDAAPGGFHLRLADGDVVGAGRVVVATGLRNQEYRPPAFEGLPGALVSHSSEHTDLTAFTGKRVAVIGRGQSACESAALLAEAGAEVEIISRGDIHWLGHLTGQKAVRKGAAAWLREALKAPSAVGPFPLSWLAEVPGWVHRLPGALRGEFTRRCLKAAAAGWLKPRFADVTCRPGRTIIGAQARSDRIAIDLDDGSRIYDHVLLGTGYRVDVARLGLLSPELLRHLSRAQGSPLLGIGFESNVPKLHFIGSYAVHSFGPLLRFIAGAPFAARSVTAAARSAAPKPAAPFAAAARGFDAAVANLSPPQ